MYCGYAALGVWHCKYHPGTYDVDTGYSCCGRKEREVDYTVINMIAGVTEYVPKPIPGCTPCDCGADKTPVHISEIEHVLSSIDHEQWKGFLRENMTIYRTKDSYDDAKARVHTLHAEDD